MFLIFVADRSATYLVTEAENEPAEVYWLKKSSR